MEEGGVNMAEVKDLYHLSSDLLFYRLVPTVLGFCGKCGAFSEVDREVRCERCQVDPMDLNVGVKKE